MIDRIGPWIVLYKSNRISPWTFIYKPKSKLYNYTGTGGAVPALVAQLPALVAHYRHWWRSYLHWWRGTGSGGAVCKGATPSVEQPRGRGFKPRLRSLLD